MLRVSSVVCWHAYEDISSALPQGGRSASGKPAVLPSHCSMEAMTAELRAPRRMTGQRDGWRRHAESGEDRWFDCAGKRAAKLSLLFPRENRVPVVPISLRNRFLALAPAVGYGVSNLAALRLGCVYYCILVLRRHVIFVSGVSFDFLVVAGHRLA